MTLTWFLLALVAVVVVVSLLRKSPTKRSSKKTQVGTQEETEKRFLPPIPKGHQIYVHNAPIAGISYRREDALAFAADKDQSLTLEREPSNTHDPNAIKVVGVSGPRTYFLGYLPKELSEQIATTDMFESIQPRLARVYVGSEGFLDIQYQIVGPKSEKKRFEAFIAEKPATPTQKDYLKFFEIPIPKGLTIAQAEGLIAKHKETSSAESQSEWEGFMSIIEEFSDPDFREGYYLKKVSKPILLDVIQKLKEQGKSYEYLSENIEEVVDKVLELKPDLERLP